MRCTSPLLLVVVPACFDPEATDDEGGGSGTEAATSTDGTTSTATVDPTTPTTDEGTSSATTGADTSTSSPGSTDDASDGTTGDLPPICDQQMPSLAACATAGVEDTPTNANLTCDTTVTDFSVFYEDVYTIDLTVGQCLYVHVDNVGPSGLTGLANADIAFQLRSPSGAYAWQDDDVGCSDPAWTGGACPQAMLTADVDGPYELAIVQASGSGCITSAEYTLYAAIDGVSIAPAATGDDLLLDCTP